MSITTQEPKKGLHDFQQSLSHYLLQSPNKAVTDPLAEWMQDPEYSDNFSIYKNNFFMSLIEVLGEAFPTLKKLVGEEFFTAMAKIYIAENPPQSACLINYGDSLPNFLATFKPCAQLGYLPDVARLECLQNQVYYANETAALCVEALQALTSEVLSTASVCFKNTCVFFQSRYAVYAIWEQNQAEQASDERVDSERSQSVLIIRDKLTIKTLEISHAIFNFLSLLEKQHDLGESLAATANRYDDFDPAQAVALLFEQQLLSQIKLADETY